MNLIREKWLGSLPVSFILSCTCSWGDIKDKESKGWGEERGSEMKEKASAIGENECVCVREKVGEEGD